MSCAAGHDAPRSRARPILALITTFAGGLATNAHAQTFADVPANHWAFSFIETLAETGITGGCGGGNYCPGNAVTRAQMAVFLERGLRGGNFVPRGADGDRFLDVSSSSFAADFVEQLSRDGITSGCGSQNYCPDASITRAQMAVFLLRAKHGRTYAPPPAAGVFADVPTGYWAANWIEQLAAEGITAGCGGGNYCPDASVTRDQMAVFLVRTFGLMSLPGAGGWDLGRAPEATIECYAEAPGAGSVPVNDAADGSWRQFRRDRKLTGRSPLVGDITCPQLLWTIDLGARTNWFSIVPGSGSGSLDLPVSGVVGGDRWTIGQQQYETIGDQIDLNGDFSHLVDPLLRGTHLLGDLLPGIAGFERIICAPEWGIVENRCYMHNWANDAWVKVWHSDLENFEANHGARPLVGDFDNDGVDEAVVSGWYQIHMLDMATGVKERTGEFLDPLTSGARENPTGRAYGWFGALDIDGQPKDEFVILGDFEHFIAVLGWQNDDIVLLWERRIETNIYQTFVRHHVLPNPVQDVDGDGLPDIATSIFNEGGDEKWHVMVFDASTGSVKLDIAEAYLSGLGDLDNDQVAELLISKTSTYGVPEYGDTYLLSFENQTQSVLWSGTNEAFVQYDAPGLPENSNSSTFFYRRDAFLRSDWTAQPVFATISQGLSEPETTLEFYGLNGGLVESMASVTGPRLKILALPESAPERGILVQSVTESAAESSISYQNVDAALLLSDRFHPFDAQRLTKVTASFLTYSAVAPLEPGEAPAVITQDFAERIRAFDVTAENDPVEMWRTPGRGMTSGDGQRQIASTYEFRSLVLANVDGGGDIELIMADQTASGTGIIKAVDADGLLVWDTELPAAGASPIWGDSGITHWAAGHFRHTDREDVLVSVRRQGSHNFQLHLLDGLTGDIVWTQTDGGVTDCFAAPIVGPGRAFMPVFDWDDDQLDEALSIGSGVLGVYDGDGSLVLHRPLFADTTICLGMNPIHGIIADATPITPIADFLNNGSEQILFGKHESALGVLHFNGDPVWLTSPYSGSPASTLEGIADLDDDGDIEIVVVGHCTTPGEEVRAYDGLTGSVRWSMSMPESCQGNPAKALSAADLDGDGREEVYFTLQNFLYALAEIDGGGQIIWRVTFSPVTDEYSTPVIADVDGSGRPQILINTPDAYLYSLGVRGQ